jgi:hypothetical protein
MVVQVVYKGRVEATMPELSQVIELAHRLRITIPISEELVRRLGLKLESIPSVGSRLLPRLTPKPLVSVFQRSNNNSSIESLDNSIRKTF